MVSWTLCPCHDAPLPRIVVPLLYPFVSCFNV
uniref:Uncharacterized protein n=1 Tax=Arundo donax TaxID=35708 RepID=A0A0A9GSR4_ARUDO